MAEGTLLETTTPNGDEHCHQSSEPNIVRYELDIARHLSQRERALVVELQSLIAQGSKKIQEVYRKFENLQQVKMQWKLLTLCDPDPYPFHWLNPCVVDEISLCELSGKGVLFHLVDKIINYSPDPDWKEFARETLYAVLKKFMSSEEMKLPGDLLEAALETDEDARTWKIHGLVHRYQQLQKFRKCMKLPENRYKMYIRSTYYQDLELQFLKLSDSHFIPLVYEILSVCPDSGWKKFFCYVLDIDEHILENGVRTMKDFEAQFFV